MVKLCLYWANRDNVKKTLSLEATKDNIKKRLSLPTNEDNNDVMNS